MRYLAIAAVLIASAGAASAAPASVTVTISPELQAKAQKTLGQRDIDGLALDLRKAVERQLAKSHAYDGGQVVLQLADAQPNRPTFKQMSDRPGLSFESVSLGGARIEGHAIDANGVMTPLSYSYYETDIRYAGRGGTWADAQWTIDRFAHDLGRNQVVAKR